MIERIGNCRIVEEIGSGGMAVIYRAVQESLNRTVAVKALKSSVAREPQFTTRFEREALSLAALQHENIIHVYDFHRLGGSLFIVMEFVEGIDLYDLLERNPVMPVEVAAIVALQVARALDHAHYRGVLHRDIKPANVMVSKSGGVKLMDFGIARDRSFEDLTEEGTGLGTPSYMSPEQILGDKLDFRSDLFSLGVVLYQMVCGRKPFVEDEAKSVMHKIRLERYVRPRRINPRVPWELERIIARCMRKRREERWRSTQELVLALERFISRRCEMNYHARAVTYLQELGVITGAEADQYLHPTAAAGGTGRPSTRAGLALPRLRRLLAVEGGALAAMALAAVFVHVAPIGARPNAPAITAPAPAPREIGFLKVIVDPWAEVWIDGRHLDTTPFAKPLALPAGTHELALRNPSYVPIARTITVEKGRTQTLRLALDRRK